MRRCAELINGVECGRSASVLDAQKSLKNGGATVYICLDCARRLYPKTFPPAPQQLPIDLNNPLGKRPKKIGKGDTIPYKYVPVDREVPS